MGATFEETSLLSESNCPLCTAPSREKLLYEDDDIYLISTKRMKGHSVRVMACIKEHRWKPTFVERTKSYAIVIAYMQKVMGDKNWFFFDSTFCTIPDHWHLMASDAKKDVEDYEQILKTPRVLMPIEV